MLRLEPAQGLPPVGAAVAIALGVLKHAKVRRWADLQAFPQDLALTTGQAELLTRFSPAVTHVAAAFDGQVLVTVIVCDLCKRWSLIANGGAADESEQST